MASPEIKIRGGLMRLRSERDAKDVGMVSPFSADYGGDGLEERLELSQRGHGFSPAVVKDELTLYSCHRNPMPHGSDFADVQTLLRP